MIVDHANSPLADKPYPKFWLFIFVGCFFGIIYILFVKPQIPTFVEQRALAGQAGNTNFLVIHMPAVPYKETFFASRAEGWLSAIKKQGYHPMLLSDIQKRLANGKTLPEKAVVLLFDPGYRYTFKVMSPLLAKYKFPAVWITDSDKTAIRKRRVLSEHVMNAMKKSGQWDVGAYDKNYAVTLETKDSSPIVIGKKEGIWREGAGRRALNSGEPVGHLNRLHVNWNWTDQQIIDRLEAEVPIEKTGFLSYKMIQGHKWGILLPASETDTTFSLKAPIDSRSAGISWLGTRGADNAQLNINVQALSGELWILMRSDEVREHYVGVCFSNGNVYVAEQKGEENIKLGSLAVEKLRQPSNFSAAIVLDGSRISVLVDGQILQTNRVSIPATEDGIIRLKLYDKILGAAHVESVSIQLTPRKIRS